MIVVPALALFSHRLPAEVRANVRSCLWEPVEAWATSLARTKGPVIPETVIQNTLHSADAASDRFAETTAPSPASPPPEAAVTPPPQAPLATDSRSGLAALGCVAIDCRPLEDTIGMHVASCRVAVDASGQLHRVFQAAGQTPNEAMAALEQTVRGWQSRREATGRESRAAIRL